MEKMAPPQSGVVGDYTLRRLDGSHLLLGDDGVTCVGSLAAAAERLDVGSVFILPHSRMSTIAQSPNFWGQHPGYEAHALGTPVRTVPVSVQLRPPWGRYVVVTDISRDSRWSSLADLDAATIGNGLRYLAAVLGRAPAYSPSFMGRNLLDRTLGYRPWLLPPEVQLEPLGGAPGAWAIAPPAGAAWVHVLDVNAAYLAPANDQAFGMGNPVEAFGLKAGDLAGLYAVCQVQASRQHSEWDGRRLPSPWGGSDASVEGWYTAPQVRAAHELGWQVEILRAAVWPRKHKTLHYWAQALWTAREALRDRGRFPNVAAAAAAGQLVKDIYSQTLSAFAKPADTREFEQGEEHFVTQGRYRWSRPDIRAWIVGECYRRRLWEIRKLREAGRAVCGLKIDALAVASMEPAGQAAAPELRWGGLGKYKVQASVPGDRARALSRAGAGTYLDRLTREAGDGAA